MKTRIIFVALLALSLFSSCAFAAKPAILADQQYLDINSGLYVLKGNVLIETGGRTIKAGQAQINIASMEVWGSGGVSIQQDDIYFSGDDVYIYSGQNKAEISGNAKLVRAKLKISASKVEYDWNSKIAYFKDNVQVSSEKGNYTTDNLLYNVETNKIL